MHSLRLPISLMLTGLLLLLAFLALFVRNSWRTEEANLRRELRMQLVSAVRNVERKSFERITLPCDPAQGDSLRVQINLRDTSVHNQIKFIAVNPGLEVSKRIQRVDTLTESKFQIKIETHEESTRNLETDPLEGFLSTLLSKKGKEGLDTAALLRVLEENFTPIGVGQKSSFSTSLVYLGKDSLSLPRMPKGAVIAAEYHDFPSNGYYGLRLADHQGYLLLKILPEILFSFLLLGCVSLSFFLIYRSFKAQFRLTEMKNEFIRNMTHELKTPIATVSVALEALQNFDALADPARTEEYLSVSQMEIKRLSLLVDKVLRLSQFEQGSMDLKSEAIDFKSLLEEVLQAMRIQFEKCGARLDYKAMEGVDFNLKGDRLHLTGVLYNLLDNALKYSPKNPEIQVFLQRESSNVRLLVKDNGIGIPKDFQGRIFDKFFRVPSGDVHNVKGHGLGLSYVYKVLKGHGGSIGVESAPGVGTSFDVQLPIQI